MKTRAQKILVIVSIPVGLLFGLVAFQVWYGLHYSHQHCILQAGMAFRIYSGDHSGRLPFSTNGFGDALVELIKADPSSLHTVCGPGDDGHFFAQALTNHSVVPEDQCSRVYVQGLSEANDPSLCLLFDRNSCPGGDHGRSPWGHRVREVCMLDGSRQTIPDKRWPEFSRQQVELLLAAGFSLTNALHIYPAAQ